MSEKDPSASHPAQTIYDALAANHPIMAKEEFDKRQKLIAPVALPNAENFENSDMGNDWWCVVYPATTLHHALAQKLGGAKSGQMMALTIDEMALLSEFMVWPRR